MRPGLASWRRRPGLAGGLLRRRPWRSASALISARGGWRCRPPSYQAAFACTPRSTRTSKLTGLYASLIIVSSTTATPDNQRSPQPRPPSAAPGAPLRHWLPSPPCAEPALESLPIPGRPGPAADSWPWHPLPPLSDGPSRSCQRHGRTCPSHDRRPSRAPGLRWPSHASSVLLPSLVLCPSDPSWRRVAPRSRRADRGSARSLVAVLAHRREPCPPAPPQAQQAALSRPYPYVRWWSSPHPFLDHFHVGLDTADSPLRDRRGCLLQAALAHQGRGPSHSEQGHAHDQGRKPRRQRLADREDHAGDEAASRVQGAHGAAGEHPGSNSGLLALTRHLQLGELQFLTHQDRDLLRQLLDQFPGRTFLGGGHLRAVRT